ncbi:MAG: phosphate acyltransferase PlsX [Balneolaceae bacterium]
MLIALDAVGGDHFPENPVLGAIEACRENSNIQILLAGPEELLVNELGKHNADDNRISILNAPQIITMDESPSSAVKSKRDSSIVAGLTAQRNGECSAFVSAGNTGALLAASALILGKLEGVHRPAIAAYFPTVKGFRLLMDAGANLEMKPEYYLQFAKMGTVYAKEVMQIKNPFVGLLNVGEEPEKGTDTIKEVYSILKQLPNFSGNVEGKDIFSAKADIFLCNGFTGNILLKFGESIPEALQQLLKIQFEKKGTSSDMRKMIFGILSETLEPFNYENVGGIPFLGVNGLSMVGHGGSSATAIKNMILNAARFIEQNVNNKIVASIR